MVESLTEIYEIRRTDLYSRADGIWCLLPIEDRYKLHPLVGNKVYYTLCFVRGVLMPLIEDNCDLAFDCPEHGFSYEIGCYFQNKKYSCVRNVNGDISMFKSLLSIYNIDKFPKEVELINKIISNLQKFVTRCKTYELDLE